MPPIAQTEVPHAARKKFGKIKYFISFFERHELKILAVATITLVLAICIFVFFPAFYALAISLLLFSILDGIIIYQSRYTCISRFVICTIIDFFLCNFIVLNLSVALQAIFLQCDELNEIYIAFELWYTAFRDAYPFVFKSGSYIGILSFAAKIWYDLHFRIAHPLWNPVKNWKLHIGTVHNTVIIVLWGFVVAYMVQLRIVYFELLSTGTIIITICICIYSCIRKSNVPANELENRLTSYLLRVAGLSRDYAKFIKQNRINYNSFVLELNAILSYHKSQSRIQHKRLIRRLVLEIEKLEAERGFQQHEREKTGDERDFQQQATEMVDLIMFIIGLCWSYPEDPNQEYNKYQSEMEHVWHSSRTVIDNQRHRSILQYGIAYGELMISHAMNNDKSTPAHIETNFRELKIDELEIPNCRLYEELRSRLSNEIQIDFMNLDKGTTNDRFMTETLKKILNNFELE